MTGRGEGASFFIETLFYSFLFADFLVDYLLIRGLNIALPTASLFRLLQITLYAE